MPIQANNEDLTGNTHPSSAEHAEHDLDVIAKRLVEIPSNLKMRVIYNSDRTVDIDGYAPRGLDEGTSGWLLRKFSYSNQQIVSRTIAYGAWSLASTYTFQ